MSFYAAQIFYIDPGVVSSAPSVGISRVELFFKNKPQATQNKSGITNPGVYVFLTGTANSVPSLSSFSNLRWSRVEYNDVNTSSDASLPTIFTFDPPVPALPDRQCAMMLAFDGSEDFVPWTDVRGDWLVGTQNPSGGGNGRDIGTYYSYISDVPSTTPVVSSLGNTQLVQVGTVYNLPSQANSTYTASSWRPKNDTCLKFNAYVARYTVHGSANLANFVNNQTPVSAQIHSPSTVTLNSNGEYVFDIPMDRYEYIAYDKINSRITNVSPGERCFPVLPFYPPGEPTKVTLACVTGSNTVTATGAVNFSTLLTIVGTQPENIIITSQNHLGANADVVNVRAVTKVVSNTSIQLDQPLSFTNAVAYFYRAPVARVDQFKTARFFGPDLDVVMLKGSTANSTQRFARFSVANVTITSGGTGYSNTDTVAVTGHDAVALKVLDAYNATANVRTNGSGVITGIYMANVGSGFSNTANVTYSILAAGGGTSNGGLANLAVTIGTNLKTEFLGFDGKGGNFANTRPINIEIGQVLPGLVINSPAGTFYNTTVRYPYYSIDDATVPTGRVTYCDPSGAADVLSVQTFTLHQPFEFSKRRVLPSWSNELFVPYANGSVSSALGGTTTGFVTSLTSNASVITVTAVSNNDFTAITAVPVGTKITYSRYIINNDETNEQGNYGNSWAKGIETRFNLANNALAEDILVYATVYKPANTNVSAYVRLYNGADNDAFDSKEWTKLELRTGNSMVSSPTNLQDTFEMIWGLKQYPDPAFVFTGTVTTTNGSNTITGSGTSWSSNTTANLVSGDMVLVQNALFPNSYMVSVVSSVANDTSITVNSAVANLNLVGTGFTISKITQKYQAFNNYLSSNVARYYASNMSEFNGFNAASVKLVMTSANGLIVPLIADLRAVAVSA